MIVGEMRLIAQTHHAQRCGHGSFSGGQDGANEQNLCLNPGWLPKKWLKWY
jgi:hypothetical protein